MPKNHLEFEINEVKKENPFKRMDETDTYTLFRRNYMLYPEGYFRGMLIMERKRSERSKDPFMLMLLDIKNLIRRRSFKWSMKKVIIKKITVALCGCSREIDIKGWYKKNRVIGILFTELNSVQKETIIEKIKESLENTLNFRQMKKISIKWFNFPEVNEEDIKNNPEINETLYNNNSTLNLGEKASKISKRVVDIVGSTLGIILCLPLFLVIPIVIKLTSKGPAIFVQKRVGLYGREFTFYKFRSMYFNNNKSIHENFAKEFIKSRPHRFYGFKMRNDPRITKIGKFLRKTSLDEIPQFFNVLKGDMSLVGPRPPIPYEVKEYDLWHKCRVREAKPGITGLWQIYGRSRCDFDNMVRMDMQYIKRWTLLTDIKLIIRTPWALLSAKGAY